MPNSHRLESLQQKVQKLKDFVYLRHERHPQLDLDLKEEDFLYQLAKVNPTNLFLGRFSKDDLMGLLDEAGLLKLLTEQGFDNPVLEIDASDVLKHRATVYDGEVSPDRMLIDVRLREGVFRADNSYVEGMEDLRSISMILIDWLTLQNPRKDFSTGKQRLVHQRKPGLGIFYEFAKLVDLFSTIAGKEGVMDVPEHYHGALLYSKLFHFWNPAMEGKLMAMKRDFADMPLYEATWAVFLDCCINADTGEVEKWSPGEQIKPVSDRMKAYFSHHDYKRQVEAAAGSFHFWIDKDKFAKAIAEHADDIA